MKFHTTRKEINGGYENVIQAGYCDLQFLLNCKKPVAYTTSSAGWAANVYDFGNTAIVTGYQPFGNIKPDYETLKHFDNQAKEIIESRAYDPKYMKDLLDKLISEFIAEVTNK